MREVGDPWLRSEYEVAEGSPLSGDDRDGSQVSEIARYGLVVAIDHLGSVTDALQGEKPIRHFAHFTALRTVLLVSARTVWLLTPAARAERRSRAIRIRITALNEWRRGTKSLGGGLADDELKTHDQVVEELRRARDELKLKDPAAAAMKLDTAEQIREQVGADDHYGAGVAYLWNTGSAAAHGYHWISSARSNPQMFDQEWFEAAVYAAWLRLNEAFEMFVAKSRKPY